MIKIYSMNTCPDCIYVEEQIQGDDRYEIIDIGSHVKYLKEFLRIRDNSPVFNEAKKVGAAGIPCLVLLPSYQKKPDLLQDQLQKECHVI